MRHYFHRHQPSHSLRHCLLAGLGSLLAIAAAGGLSLWAGTPFLMAPFGASCVLLFSVPASPLSQPMNVVGGHVIASAVAVALRALFPNAWWAAALAVGLAIALMAALRITHPPAGADVLVVFGADPGPFFLVCPVLLGSLVLVAIASAFHNLTRTPYPLKPA